MANEECQVAPWTKHERALLGEGRELVREGCEDDRKGWSMWLYGARHTGDG